VTTPSVLADRLSRSDAGSTVRIAAALSRQAADGVSLAEVLPRLRQAIRRWEPKSHYTAACHSIEIAMAHEAERAARALCEAVVAHSLTQRDEGLLLELLLDTEQMYGPNMFVSATIALSGEGLDVSPAFAVLLRALSADDPDQRVRVARLLSNFAGTPRSTQRHLVADVEPLLPSMRAALSDPLERVRRSVSRLLAVHHLHRAAWPDIAALLDSPDAAVRFGATKALLSAPLGGLDISPALPRLRELCSDPDSDVAQSARDAIRYFEKYSQRV
jgi:hypothetical protein